MPILTKEGKEYRTFSEPNPLVENQDNIEKGNLEFHNFKWKKEISKAEPIKKTEPIIKPEKIEEFIKEVSEIKEEIKEETPKIETPKIEKEASETKDDGYVEVGDDSILLVHILPIYLVDKVDELYGETRKIRKYGNKFEIESVLMEISDLAIQILSDSKIERNSIMYPSRYKNGEDAGINRWWKVTHVEENDGNYLIQGIPSDFHPDFSS